MKLFAKARVVPIWKQRLTRFCVYERQQVKHEEVTVDDNSGEIKYCLINVDNYREYLANSLLEVEKECQIKKEKAKQQAVIRAFTSRLMSNDDVNEEELLFWTAQGIDLNAYYPIGQRNYDTMDVTPICHAISEGRYHLLRLLLKVGADPNVGDDYRSTENWLFDECCGSEYIMLSILYNFGYELKIKYREEYVIEDFYKARLEREGHWLYDIWTSKEMHIFDLALRRICKDNIDDQLDEIIRQFTWNGKYDMTEVAQYLEKFTEPSIRSFQQKLIEEL